ncbi:hypothetical protein JZ751_019479 [Albula glossodonta]|uniref:Uncharacterized protein n=1 Tax=Albula glossodonta TaxID=121402 RepID=A0A8T2NKU8_9TELE|nr:hypothetical protein JZ751_019479 [Albula glossodonta]
MRCATRVAATQGTLSFLYASKKARVTTEGLAFPTRFARAQKPLNTHSNVWSKVQTSILLLSFR